MSRGAEIDGELGCPPRQRDSGAAVSVVVYYQSIADLLRADDETGAAIRTQSADRSNDPIRRNIDSRQARRLGYRCLDQVLSTGRQKSRSTRDREAFQKFAAMHSDGPSQKRKADYHIPITKLVTYEIDN